MPSILSHPEMVYKKVSGFDFPQFFEYYRKAIASPWRPEEVAMGSDVTDWEQNLNVSEKHLLAGLLRGFTVMEMGISDYWADVVCGKFPKPEVKAMARAFSLQEQIHAHAYNHLSDTLGINEFEAFLQDPIAQQKVEKFFHPGTSEKVTLAVFSGAGEGVSLFSSFAILLAFAKSGRMKGLAQIISWSTLDEQNHSDGGSELFKQLVAEEGITESEISQILQGFEAVIYNEFAFLDNIFNTVDNSAIPVSLPELKAYIKYRANNRLKNLNLGTRIQTTPEEDQLALNISAWFEPMIRGQQSSDFFARQKAGDSYISKPSQDFNSVDLSSLELVLT
jgi:ribonucleoside-diphosphate reductase beta chain